MHMSSRPMSPSTVYRLCMTDTGTFIEGQVGESQIFYLSKVSLCLGMPSMYARHRYTKIEGQATDDVIPFKGTVATYFLPTVFSITNTHMGPRFIP
jgi:hypothetical protein